MLFLQILSSYFFFFFFLHLNEFEEGESLCTYGNSFGKLEKFGNDDLIRIDINSRHV